MGLATGVDGFNLLGCIIGLCPRPLEHLQLIPVRAQGAQVCVQACQEEWLSAHGTSWRSTKALLSQPASPEEAGANGLQGQRQGLPLLEPGRARRSCAPSVRVP